MGVTNPLDVEVLSIFRMTQSDMREYKIRGFLCNHGGLGRDRTGDLTIFSRSLVPTELPSQTRFQRHLPNGIRHQNLCDPDGT